MAPGAPPWAATAKKEITKADSANTRGRKKRWAGAVGLLAAGVITGGVLASRWARPRAALPRQAAAPCRPGAAARPGRRNPGGAQPVRSDEKSVPSATAATLRAAALKAVAGGTVDQIETDAGDGVYEVHVPPQDAQCTTQVRTRWCGERSRRDRSSMNAYPSIGFVTISRA